MICFIEKVSNIQELFAMHGGTYTGLYMAFISFAFLIVIFDSTNYAISCYIYYVMGLFLFILILNGSFLMENESSLYMIFPIIVLIIMGGVILVKNINEKKTKRKISSIQMSGIIFLLVLVEASVPLQISFDSFSAPTAQGKASVDIIAISEMIGEESVMVPVALQSRLKTYNNDIYMPAELTSDSIYSRSDIAQIALLNQITYVVLERSNYLGETNEEEIKTDIGKYGYNYVGTVGEYLVFRHID